MANEEPSASNKYTPSNNNLKVPPIKIVLSSHQSNNAVVNMANSSEEDPSGASDRDFQGASTGADHRAEHKKFSQRNNSNQNASDNNQGSADRSSRRYNRLSGLTSDNNGSEVGISSGGRASSSSDRSTSSTPSSESESIASNSTIISEPNSHQQQQQYQQQARTNRISFRDDASSTSSSTTTSNTSKQELRSSRPKSISRAFIPNERVINPIAAGKKFQNDPSAEQGSETPNSREHTHNSNQRITRSSQRAAQQVKVESNSAEFAANDETNMSENQDKTSDSSRKVKRRKGEVLEPETDSSQVLVPQPPPMANICPADYQLPSQNSFQLYRDIRNRPLMKLKKLTNVQPKTPQGFKEYLLNSGPYLLDGNKLGVGLTGSSSEKSTSIAQSALSRLPNRKRVANPSSSSLSDLRHTTYKIPKISSPPSKLEAGSQLYKLFQDQEAARHQMRVQHLKERERSILTAEQEILRTYTRAAVADKRQKRNLSACTYLYFQERYHYLDDDVSSQDKVNSSDQAQLTSDAVKSPDGSCQIENPSEKLSGGSNIATGSDERSSNDNEGTSKIPSETVSDKHVALKDQEMSVEEACSDKTMFKSEPTASSVELVQAVCHEFKGNSDATVAGTETEKPKSFCQDNQNSLVLQTETQAPITEEDLRNINRDELLIQLQDVDEKWEKTRNDMLVRHKNEADSLYAIQSMEWEWKAKELGLCDIRVSYEIEPELVPRVQVQEIDY